MNQINPFYIILLFVAIIVFLFVKISNFEDKLNDAKNSYQENKKIAIELKEYKDTFKKAKSSFKKEIANKYWIKQNNIKLIYISNGVKIEAKKLKLEILNRLVSRIFNGIYKIKSFNIETKDNKTASFEMSLQW
jgi:uncharacterized protein YneF (UPF0154 family)